MSDTIQKALFALLRSGLWEQEIELSPYAPIDFDALYRLAEEQSVIGLVAAGLEHITDVKPQKLQARPFLVSVIAQEQRNTAMNDFIIKLWTRFSEESISAVLVKGQGVAQCYSRPLWRASGDVDILLDAENYEKAKHVLSQVATSVDPEGQYTKHLGMKVDGFVVELHGTFRAGLSPRMDAEIDRVQGLVNGGQMREWSNNSINVQLPIPWADAVLVFTHILKHLYKGGIGLRQICDWSRLMYVNKDNIDKDLLKESIDNAGIMVEWQVFGLFTIDYLGMRPQYMPFVVDSPRMHRKTSRLYNFILRVGNFGYNRDLSYYSRYPFLIRKVISAGQRIGDAFSHMRLFPKDSMTFLYYSIMHGLQAAFPVKH